jgi:hypothetical protein
MKVKIIKLIFVAVLFVSYSSAQQPDETLIRKLEDQERSAILKGDTVMLAKLMSPGIIVQNPENAIVSYRQIIDRIKTGKISYSSFERNIEKISFIENIAIVMGMEKLTPQGTSQNSGKTVKRRFTNIWMKTNNDWKLTARQATVISIE